jgi:hypothetical protein
MGLVKISNGFEHGFVGLTYNLKLRIQDLIERHRSSAFRAKWPVSPLDRGHIPRRF